VSLASVRQAGLSGKFFQIKARSLFQILYRFSNSFALGRGASFRVQDDKSTFVGGSQHGCEQHGLTQMWVHCARRLLKCSRLGPAIKLPAVRLNAQGCDRFSKNHDEQLTYDNPATSKNSDGLGL